MQFSRSISVTYIQPFDIEPLSIDLSIGLISVAYTPPSGTRAIFIAFIQPPGIRPSPAAYKQPSGATFEKYM